VNTSLVVRSGQESHNITTGTFPDRLPIFQNDLFNRCAASILIKRTALRKMHLIPEDDFELEKWIEQKRSIFLQGDPKSLEYKRLFKFFIMSGIMFPILWEDWGVDRDAALVARKLGIKSFADLQNMVAENAGEAPVHFHVGPGDCSNMQELRHSDAASEDRSHWKHYGIGDRLYFPLEKITRKFLKEGSSPEVQNLFSILSVFVTREFRRLQEASLKSNDEKNIVPLDCIWDIFATLPDWIHKHYDPVEGKYLSSDIFEQDSTRELNGRIRAYFNQLSLLSKSKSSEFKKKSLSRLLSQVFSDEFVQQVFSKERTISLEEHLDINMDGFIFGDFESLYSINPFTTASAFPSESFSVMSGCRSDSHLQEWDYSVFIHRFVFRALKDGGVYISDGIIESYSKIGRWESLAEMFRHYKERFRAFIVVDRKTNMPLSVYIERGVVTTTGCHFYPEEKLASTFNLEEVQLVPPDVFAARNDILLESQSRKVIFREIGAESRNVFRRINEVVREKTLEVLSESSLAYEDDTLASQNETLEILKDEVVERVMKVDRKVKR
jgi:hypothetical protein